MKNTGDRTVEGKNKLKGRKMEMGPEMGSYK